MYKIITSIVIETFSSSTLFPINYGFHMGNWKSAYKINIHIINIDYKHFIIKQLLQMCSRMHTSSATPILADMFSINDTP